MLELRSLDDGYYANDGKGQDCKHQHDQGREMMPHLHPTDDVEDDNTENGVTE